MTTPFYSRYIPPTPHSQVKSPIESRVANLKISNKKKAADLDLQPKKPKKRKILSAKQNQQDAEQDDEKHKAVLAKFKKSVFTSSAKDNEEESETESENGNEESSEEDSVEDAELEENAVKGVI